MKWYANPWTGLFTRLSAIDARPHDPPLHVWSGDAPAGSSGGETATASGIGWDSASAEAACVGEAIERLHALPLPDDVLMTASYADWPLAEPAVDPTSWVLFHPEQYRQPDFPFERLTRDTTCAWVCCREALTGEPRWAPAELIYLNWPNRHRFAAGLSTGLAAGRTGHPLVLRGLQEVIERDAVVGAWWGRYPLDEHPLDEVFQSISFERRVAIQRPGLTYRCFRIDSALSSHVTMVTVEGEDREGFCFSVGTACRETRAASWTKAVLEAIHGRHYVRHLKAQVAADTLHAGLCPTTFGEHALYWSLRSETGERGTSVPRSGRYVFDRILNRGTDVPRSPGNLENLADLVALLGPKRPVLVRDMTPPALAAEQLGWHVVRVVVPGLQPLHGNHAWPHLGGPLWAPRSLTDWQSMPPHPFP